VSTKAEPHYLAENPKDLLQENSLVRRENIKMQVLYSCKKTSYSSLYRLLIQYYTSATCFCLHVFY